MSHLFREKKKLYTVLLHKWCVVRSTYKTSLLYDATLRKYSHKSIVDCWTSATLGRETDYFWSMRMTLHGPVHFTFPSSWNKWTSSHSCTQCWLMNGIWDFIHCFSRNADVKGSSSCSEIEFHVSKTLGNEAMLAWGEDWDIIQKQDVWAIVLCSSQYDSMFVRSRRGWLLRLF